MLSTDSRVIAIDLLRPPPGHRLDRAILTTFSLDLEALLALPLAVLSQSDSGIEELLADPLLLLESLREAGERIHVFVDRSGIAVPRSARALYAMLEASVHPVQAPNGGVFHPKVWVARFVAVDGTTLLRTAVLSRNLTYDCSWDIALTSSGPPKQSVAGKWNGPLRNLLEALPDLALHPLAPTVSASILQLAEEVGRTRFPAPDGFDDHLQFHSFGLKSDSRRTWRPLREGSRILAIAPFANRSALDSLAGITEGSKTLISRAETLDAIPVAALERWNEKLVLSSLAEGEADDNGQQKLSGLHAKLIAIEHGWGVTWFAGSANLTAAAFTGLNVEMMASISGRKGRPDGKTGHGVDRFLESGIRKLCLPYERTERATEDPAIVDARTRLEQLQRELLSPGLEISCSADDEAWNWTLTGALSIPADIRVLAWPLSIEAHQSKPLELPLTWRLPTARLTSFVAFVLSVPGVAVDDVRLTLKLPASGMPESRITQILRTLIDSPERFLQFLQALLGGLEGLVDWPAPTGKDADTAPWMPGSKGQSLLENLLRTASRDPGRLEPIRRLIDDLRAAENEERIIPDSFLEVWSVVEQAIAGQAGA